MTNKKDEVQLNVRIPAASYANMKLKAQEADISINKLLNRAGSIVTTQQLVEFPLTSSQGAVTVENSSQG